jgi:Right handed beta helix region
MSTFSMTRHIFLRVLVLTALSVASVTQAQTEPAPATCTVISAIPISITAPGAYCLTEDLTTTSSGIAVNADDVVIDCNHHKLATLDGSVVIGVSSVKSRTTVRRCTIRGFRSGVEFIGGPGHIVEDNLIEGSSFIGINIGNDSLVRGNLVLNTGTPGAQLAIGIQGLGANTQVLDNQVVGVIAENSTISAGFTSGIAFYGGGHTARGNTVQDIQVTGASAIRRAYVIRDNSVVNAVRRGGTGIVSAGADCRGNEIVGFATGVDCAGGISSGNLFVP